jgi:hypothetical protein
MSPRVVSRALLVLVFGLGLGACNRRSQPDDDGIARPKGLFDEAPPPPPKCKSRTLLNQQIVVGAGGWQSHPFSVKDQNCSINVRVSGVRDTGKGFSVHVLPGDEAQNYKANRPFKEIPTLSGLDVTSLDLSEELPTGGYSVLVANTNNIFNSMVVNVTVTSAPR